MSWLEYGIQMNTWLTCYVYRYTNNMTFQQLVPCNNPQREPVFFTAEFEEEMLKVQQDVSRLLRL